MKFSKRDGKSTSRLWGSGIEFGLVYYATILVSNFIMQNDLFTWRKVIGQFILSMFMGILWSETKGVFFQKKEFRQEKFI